jgi:hypothetical protein
MAGIPILSQDAGIPTIGYGADGGGAQRRREEETLLLFPPPGWLRAAADWVTSGIRDS